MLQVEELYETETWIWINECQEYIKTSYNLIRLKQNLHNKVDKKFKTLECQVIEDSYAIRVMGSCTQ